jgi:hypothetical protein
MAHGGERFGEAIGIDSARRLGRRFATDPLDAYKWIERHPLSRVRRIGDQELRRILSGDNFPRASSYIDWIVRLAHGATSPQDAIKLVD